MEYSRIEAWPLDRMKRSRSGQWGSAGSWRMTRVNRTWASGASAMAVPGWPESAFCGASMARPRMTLIPSCSSSASVTMRTVPAGRRRQPGGTESAEAPATARSRRPGPVVGVGRAVAQQRHRRREPVDEVPPSDRARARRRRRTPPSGTAPRCSDRTRTSWCGSAEQPRPPAVAGEDERGVGPARRHQRVEVLVGGRGVAQMELHGGAHRHGVADGDGARGAVGADARCAPGSRRGRSAPCARR